MTFEELEQFVLFAEEKTLAKTAAVYHISAPTLTRSMRHVEDYFGTSLFIRTGNHLELNEAGKLAAVYAQKILQDREEAKNRVQELVSRQETITVMSCAPAPLWRLMPRLNELYPSKQILSGIASETEILRLIAEGKCDLGVFPREVPGSVFFMNETLFLAVPEDHILAKKESVTFAELNGMSFLQRSNLGYWEELKKRVMPDSSFLVQNSSQAFQELVEASRIPSFITDVSAVSLYEQNGRVRIPIRDKEAMVSYFLTGELKDKIR